MTKYNLYCPKLPILMLALQKYHDNVCQKWPISIMFAQETNYNVHCPKWEITMFAAQNSQFRYVCPIWTIFICLPKITHFDMLPKMTNVDIFFTNYQLQCLFPLPMFAAQNDQFW